MPGVAYTTGSDLDEDHKEIHLSLEYVAGIAPDRVADEICGVLTHELVHCFQYNGFGTCPAGLIEGIADWIRMRCGYVPPHWKRHASGKWDAGYQITGYFLDYLEKRFGDGLMRKLNEKLRVGRYEEKSFWHELVGHDINRLWEEYRQNFQP
ncbi:hypothetical protein Golomagni_07465 [Golovinomyces magnicellulatus]|nr:hypothetical protein Golomagni_07465 [Golovinomyces magnicellulatus]